VELPTRTKKTASLKFVPIRNSELYVRIRQWAVDSKQATAKFKIGQGVQFHFLEGWFDMPDLGAVFDHQEPLLQSRMRSIAVASQDHQRSVALPRRLG
jgi:hypothetical protein